MSQSTILLTGAPPTTPADMPSSPPANAPAPTDDTGQTFDDVLSRQRQATSSREEKQDAERAHSLNAPHVGTKPTDVRATQSEATVAKESMTKGAVPEVSVPPATSKATAAPIPLAAPTPAAAPSARAEGSSEDESMAKIEVAIKGSSPAAPAHDVAPKAVQPAPTSGAAPAEGAEKVTMAPASPLSEATAPAQSRPVPPSPLAEANALSREQAAKTPGVASDAVANTSSTLVTTSPTMVGTQQLTGLDAAEQSSDLASSEPTLTLTSHVDISGLVASISRPVLKADGEYSVKVSLHPPQLGEVRAIMTMKGDTLHVVLTPDKSEGHAALQSSLSDLKEQLGRHGAQVDVELGQPGSDGGRDQATPMRTVGVTASSPSASAFSPAPSIVESGRVRLVL